MIAPGPTVETARLILRPTAEEDLDGWAEMMADEEASRFVGGLMGRAQSWRGLASMAGSWAIRGYGMFSLIEKSSGQWVGRIGPWQPEEWPGTEVGWGLHPRAWGKGYAIEAATAAIDWAFASLGWTEVIHCIDPGNVNSQKVALALGSTNRGEGRIPPPYHELPIDIWGQTREAWQMPEGGGMSRALALAMLLALAPVAVGAQGEDGSLTVAFDGVNKRQGVVLIAVFDSKAAYDANTNPVRTFDLSASGGNFSVTIAGLKPGLYAVKSFHDRDVNGKMNFNPLGMPLEPYGFSNNARAPFGPPSWRRAAFEVKPGGNGQTIRLR